MRFVLSRLNMLNVFSDRLVWTHQLLSASVLIEKKLIAQILRPLVISFIND